METNNKIEALKLHLDETPNTANYTVKQSEWDDDLFIVEFTHKMVRMNDFINNAIQITEGLKFSFDENVIKKEYLVLTDCETEARWDENLKDYIDDYLDTLSLDVNNSVGILIDYFDFDYWKQDTKIEQTAAMSFNSIGGEEYYSTYNNVDYNIYEIETGESNEK